MRSEASLFGAEGGGYTDASMTGAAPRLARSRVAYADVDFAQYDIGIDSPARQLLLYTVSAIVVKPEAGAPGEPRRRSMTMIFAADYCRPGIKQALLSATSKPRLAGRPIFVSAAGYG